MTVIAPNQADLERFQTLVARELGLRFDDGGRQNLERVLLRRLVEQDLSCTEYLHRLDLHPSREIIELTAELTVGETYFLRHVEQFQALTRTALPDLLRTPGRTTPLRLLSAGCSTGEETYSLAIALRESAIGPDASILGVDVNPLSLATARGGRYTDWSLRTVPAATKQRWFSADGQLSVLDPSVQAAVRFEQRNFSQDDPDLWQPESFDVVFCRNVIMYFTPEVMTQVIARIYRSLIPGGYLFLGSAETLRGLSDDFRLRESQGSFYYQRPAPAAKRPGLAPDPGPGPVRVPRAVPVVGNLDSVLDLLSRERFADALSVMDSLADPADPDPEALLIRAALLTHSGSLSAAERACRRLLEVDGRSAGAHVLLAMCREGEQDLPAAADHYRTAISFDPEFAMPHVHLGRLARRMGDRGTAHRQYAQSERLLPTETVRRILLFGGGFDREALISLCRTQSAAAGGGG
jgi:chemotaxis protein methyltransferase CheR